MKWAVVVPSNRPERLKKFLEAWKEQFVKHDVNLYVVRDEPPWEGIPDFIPKRTDMIRSWGFYKAWRDDCEYTVSLDDDVLPHAPDFFERYESGFTQLKTFSSYLSVGDMTTSRLQMRGFPYRGRNSQVAVQYGGWNGCLDLDAATQLQQDGRHDYFVGHRTVVPRGCATTCCAMNFAFRTEHTVKMWQLPLLEGRYNRFGDIWSGLIQKRVLDHMGQVMLINPFASVMHNRASDPYVNLVKEAPGMGPNEDLWDHLEEGNFVDVTDRFATYFKDRDPEYATYFLECRDRWLDLFH